MRIRRTPQTAVLMMTLVATACAGEGSTVATSPSATETLSSSPSADATTSPSSVTSPEPAPEIEDGRHFVFVKDAKTGSPGAVRFDLAYFLTGDAANQAAEDNGDEVPCPTTTTS